MQIVLDTDPGIDDLMAIALAATAPELRIAAVITSYGNASLAQTTTNARYLMELIGAAVPVVPGSDGPLERSFSPSDRHGPTATGYAVTGPSTRVEPNPTALLDVLGQADGDVVLVTLGPLTNLARAIRDDVKTVRSSVVRHLGVFGSGTAPADSTRWADFNSWCDPEAVEVVLAAGIATDMIGFDTVSSFVLDPRVCESAPQAPNSLTGWLCEALRFYIQSHARRRGVDGCFLGDVLPVCELVSPGTIRFDVADATVDTSNGPNRGRTHIARGTGIRVARSLDSTVVEALLSRVLNYQSTFRGEIE